MAIKIINPLIQKGYIQQISAPEMKDDDPYYRVQHSSKKGQSLFKQLKNQFQLSEDSPEEE